MSEPRIRLVLSSARARLLRDLLGAVDSVDGAAGWRAVAQSLLEDLLAAMSAGQVPEMGRRDGRLRKRAARRSGKAAELPARSFYEQIGQAFAFPKPDPADRKARKRSAEDEHRERMRVIRAALVARSGNGLCERCHCRQMVDPHHLFGRGKGGPPESERNCVGLCRPCHEEMQHPQSVVVAVECWRWAGQHLEELGFGDEAAMAWARMRAIEDRRAVATAGAAVRAAEMMAVGRGKR